MMLVMLTGQLYRDHVFFSKSLMPSAQPGQCTHTKPDTRSIFFFFKSVLFGVMLHRAVH